MYETIVVALSFALVVALLRLGWRVGRALLLSALLLALVLPATSTQLWEFMQRDWHRLSWHRTFPVQTVDLVLLVVLVNFLGEVMSELGLSSRLPGAMRGLLRSRRLALAGVPAMMGLMPTPGGIMLSAPIVKEAAAEYGMPPARAAMVNYWFRHVWEFSFPLFPALAMTAGILGAEVGTVILHTCYVTVAALLFGGLFLLRGFPGRGAVPAAARPGLGASVRDLLAAVWPVALALALCTALRMPAGLALAVAVALMTVARRIRFARIRAMLVKSLEADLIMVVLAAMSYRAVLDASGAVGAVSDFIVCLGMPVPVLIFVLPFMTGVITGIASAAVGLSLPLLLEFLAPDGRINYPLVALALYGGMSGVFVTPVHLCFALSKDYFKVRFGQLYRQVVPLVATVAAVVFVTSLLWARLNDRSRVDRAAAGGKLDAAASDRGAPRAPGEPPAERTADDDRRETRRQLRSPAPVP